MIVAVGENVVEVVGSLEEEMKKMVGVVTEMVVEETT